MKRRVLRLEGWAKCRRIIDLLGDWGSLGLGIMSAVLWCLKSCCQRVGDMLALA